MSYQCIQMYMCAIIRYRKGAQTLLISVCSVWQFTTAQANKMLLANDGMIDYKFLASANQDHLFITIS